MQNSIILFQKLDRITMLVTDPPRLNSITSQIHSFANRHFTLPSQSCNFKSFEIVVVLWTDMIFFKSSIWETLNISTCPDSFTTTKNLRDKKEKKSWESPVKILRKSCYSPEKFLTMSWVSPAKVPRKSGENPDKVGIKVLRKSWERPENVLKKFFKTSPEKVLRKFLESPEKTMRKSFDSTEKVLKKSWESPEKVLRNS